MDERSRPEEAIAWTPHALQQLAERGLGRDFVEDALQRADQIVEAHEGRFAAHKWTTTRKRGRRALLRVVFERHPDHLLVVTVFVSDRPHRYWQGEIP